MWAGWGQRRGIPDGQRSSAPSDMKWNGLSIGSDGRKSNGDWDWMIWMMRRGLPDWIVTATSRWCCGAHSQIRLKLSSLRYWVVHYFGSMWYSYKYMILFNANRLIKCEINHEADPFLYLCRYTMNIQSISAWAMHTMNISVIRLTAPCT